jgi:hypothetical protein
MWQLMSDNGFVGWIDCRCIACACAGLHACIAITLIDGMMVMDCMLDDRLHDRYGGYVLVTVA